MWICFWRIGLSNWQMNSATKCLRCHMICNNPKLRSIPKILPRYFWGLKEMIKIRCRNGLIWFANKTRTSTPRAKNLSNLKVPLALPTEYFGQLGWWISWKLYFWPAIRGTSLYFRYEHLCVKNPSETQRLLRHWKMLHKWELQLTLINFFSTCPWSHKYIVLLNWQNGSKNSLTIKLEIWKK